MLRPLRAPPCPAWCGAAKDPIDPFDGSSVPCLRSLAHHTRTRTYATRLGGFATAWAVHLAGLCGSGTNRIHSYRVALCTTSSSGAPLRSASLVLYGQRRTAGPLSLHLKASAHTPSKEVVRWCCSCACLPYVGARAEGARMNVWVVVTLALAGGVLGVGVGWGLVGVGGGG